MQNLILSFWHSYFSSLTPSHPTQCLRLSRLWCYWWIVLVCLFCFVFWNSLSLKPRLTRPSLCPLKLKPVLLFQTSLWVLDSQEWFTTPSRWCSVYLHLKNNFSAIYYIERPSRLPVNYYRTIIFCSTEFTKIISFYLK